MGIDGMLFDFKLTTPVPSHRIESRNLKISGFSIRFSGNSLQTSVRPYQFTQDQIPREMLKFAKTLKIDTGDLTFNDFQGDIAHTLHEHILEIPPNNPFYNSGLIVFKDSYQGVMFQNRIHYSDFKAMTKTYLDIISHRTNIQIEGNIQFQETVNACIKEWMMVQLGRDGINDILTRHASKTLIIKQVTPAFPETATKKGRTAQKVVIYFDPEDDFIVLTQSKTKGLLQANKSPAYLSLWHEVEHARNIFSALCIEEFTRLGNRSPTLDGDYHTYEEQRVIMPTASLGHFPTNREEAEQISWSPVNSPPHKSYTENDLRSVIREPLRKGHNGINRRPEPLDFTQSESIKYFIQACFIGYFSEVQAILPLLSSPDIMDPDDPQKTTPLQIAAQGKRSDVFNLLLAHHANPKYIGPQGHSLAHYVIETGDVEFLQDLYERNLIDLKEADASGLPLIYHAISTLEDSCIPMVRFLICKNVSCLTLTHEGENALHAASAMTDLSLFDDLYLLGLNPHHANQNGIKPVHTAFIHGNLPLALRLCSRLEDYYQLTPCGKSLMFFAAWSGQPQAVSFLLSIERQYAGQYHLPFRFITGADFEGALPISYAFKQADAERGEDFIQFLLKEGFSLQPTQHAAFVKLFVLAEPPLREQMLDVVYRYQYNVELPLCNGVALLQFAIDEDDLQLASYAIARGANPNRLIFDPLVTTLLHRTVDNNQREMTRLLLNAGADATQPDSYGVTPKDLILSKFKDNEIVDQDIFKMLFPPQTVANVHSLKRHMNSSNPVLK